MVSAYIVVLGGKRRFETMEKSTKTTKTTETSTNLETKPNKNTQINSNLITSIIFLRVLLYILLKIYNTIQHCMIHGTYTFTKYPIPAVHQKYYNLEHALPLPYSNTYTACHLYSTHLLFDIYLV